MTAKLIKDASVWQDMAGDDELEKRINSYLTTQFIQRHNVKADECLEEAKTILTLIREALIYKAKYTEETT